MDLSGLDSDSNTNESQAEGPYQQLIDFTGGRDIVELFGQSGSGKSRFTTEVLKDALNNHNADTLFIDTESNIADDDDLDGSDYCYIPEWNDIYYYIRGVKSKVGNDAFGKNNTGSTILEDGYDVVAIDSVGFPALVAYADYRVDDNADQFQVFLQLESIVGHLKKYSQINDALILVLNQPKSDLSGSKDPAPFGDKSIYGMKDVIKTVKKSSNEVATNCTLESYRSRQAGKGKDIFRMKIDDSGVDIDYVADEAPEDEWSV